MELDEILRQTKAMIQDYAGDDPNKLFYAYRYVFARLQLPERQAKALIKRQLMDAGAKCHGCNGVIDSPKRINVHRLDGNLGYSLENCVLMHGECHEKFHQDHPSKGGRKKPTEKSSQAAVKIHTKLSKRYEGHSFIYWWDVTPSGSKKLTKYDLIKFVLKDTGAYCSLPPATITGFLTRDRQTTRQGNWGIKVIRGRENELAFEPGIKGKDWLFLPVVWKPADSDHRANEA